MIFSVLSFLVAIPSAIKVFNWTATLYKGSISCETPMLYALGFIGLFTHRRPDRPLPRRARPRRARARHLLRRRPLPLHHGRRRGHGLPGRPALLVAEDDRPDVPREAGPSSRPCSSSSASTSPSSRSSSSATSACRAATTSTRDEFQVLNVLSTAGASILGVGYLLPLCYLLWSLRYGATRRRNPWGATGLEWQTAVAAAHRELRETPVVTQRGLRLRSRPRLSAPLREAPLAEHAPPALQHHFDDLEQQQRGGLARDVGLPRPGDHVLRRPVHRLHRLPATLPRGLRRRAATTSTCGSARQHRWS